MTCICGVLAALLPQGVGGVLTVVPYLVAMVLILFRFLKKNKRAPNQTERKKFTLGFTLIFWFYNRIQIKSNHHLKNHYKIQYQINRPQFQKSTDLLL